MWFSIVSEFTQRYTGMRGARVVKLKTYSVREAYGPGEVIPEGQSLLAGKEVGIVRQRLFTRERKIPGKRYVLSRWESPGWVFEIGPGKTSAECYSRAQAAKGLIEYKARQLEPAT